MQFKIVNLLQYLKCELLKDYIFLTRLGSFVTHIGTSAKRKTRMPAVYKLCGEESLPVGEPSSLCE